MSLQESSTLDERSKAAFAAVATAEPRLYGGVTMREGAVHRGGER